MRSNTQPMRFDALTDTNVDVAVPPELFFWGIGAILLIFALISTVLVYHWHHYSYTKTTMVPTTITYFIGSGIFIVIMISSAVAYLSSV